MKKLLHIVLLSTVLMLSACEEKLTIPDGFELINSHDVFHFVYLDTKVVKFKDKVKLRNGGKAICMLTKTENYCEVYMWDDRELVSKTIPVENRKEVAVIYTLKAGKVKLKVIK